MMPTPLLTFLAALFKVPKHKLFRSSITDLEELINPLDPDENQEEEQQHTQHESVPEQQPETWVRDHKSTQLHTLLVADNLLW